MRNLREEGGRDRPQRLPGARRHAGRLGQDGAHLRLLRVLPPGRATSAKYTKKPIGITMGASSLRDLFDEKYYDELEGGILESFGRLFKNDLRLYIYPLLESGRRATLITVDNLEVPPELRKLYGYLVDNGYIRQLENVNRDYLPIFSRDALRKIKMGDSTWEAMVPPEVAEVIKRRRFFGYRPTEPTNGSPRPSSHLRIAHPACSRCEATRAAIATATSDSPAMIPDATARL